MTSTYEDGAPERNPAANHFIISGAGIEGDLDLTSITGKPVATIQVDGESVQRTDIHDLAHGTVVEGTIKDPPDGERVLLTVVIPDVRLGSASETAPGLAVITRIRSLRTVPPGPSGAIQSYEVRPVVITASSVQS